MVNISLNKTAQVVYSGKYQYVKTELRVYESNKQTNSVARSPQANHTN
jgi:hypothetical protein